MPERFTCASRRTYTTAPVAMVPNPCWRLAGPCSGVGRAGFDDGRPIIPC
jgi:hypothetical protein